MIEQFFQIGENWIDKEEYLFQLIDAIVFLCFMVCVLYLFVFAVYSKRKSTYKYPTTMKKYRFAALFPAYGEDEVIIDSVKSFLQQDYPRELYDIIVIANQMRQETLDRLKSLSVKIIKMENPQSTKIEALKAAIRYIEEGKTKYDNVIILDADNIVKNNYIEKINDAIYAGCSAIQTHRVAKNRDSSIAVLDAVSEEINNSIFRKGHTRLGFSSALSGSGMAFEYGLFKNIIQGCNDIGEDKYMERKLLLQNIYIEYLEDVYTYDEKVRGKKDFYNQRQRWLATQFHNLLSGILQIPGALIKGNWDYCDKLFQWMMPPRVLLLGFITLIAAILPINDQNSFHTLHPLSLYALPPQRLTYAYYFTPPEYCIASSKTKRAAVLHRTTALFCTLRKSAAAKSLVFTLFPRHTPTSYLQPLRRRYLHRCCSFPR